MASITIAERVITEHLLYILKRGPELLSLRDYTYIALYKPQQWRKTMSRRIIESLDIHFWGV